MHGLMQDVPLSLRMALERARDLYPTKTVTTKTADGVRTRTYGEIVERAARLANVLTEMGVQAGDRVATFGWNSDRHLELYLAVPCMGAVLHTLNIRLHPGQVTWIANHAEDTVVFVDSSLAQAWAKVGDVPTLRRVVSMDDGTPPVEGADDYEALLAAASPDFQWPSLDERSAAAMCYTSGTTGDPKGVVYSHRSATLHSLACLYTDTMGLSERDVMLPIVPQFHANAWGTPYAALMSGASLAMPSRFMDPESVAALVEAAGVTVSAAVPTVWFGVLQAVKAGQLDVRRLASLKRIVVGGSAVPEALMKAYDQLGITIVHAWGMTETSPLGTLATVRSTVEPGDVDRIRLTQGLPSPGLVVRVVSEGGEVAPWDGQTMGELEISGPWIADAYYDPTAPDGRGGQDRFVEADGRRWLRTGDVAVIDPLGYVKLVDRTKDLVKSGGEWISTVELEGLLLEVDGVREAAVIAVPDPKWGERPLALVVREDESVTEDRLKGFLGERVAGWQLPDRFEFIEEVPKTSVGKFDKKVLRDRYAKPLA